MNPTTTLLHLLLIAATVMAIGTKTHAAEQPGPYKDMLHRQAVEAAVREQQPPFEKTW